jgi:hypothetical protein
MAIVQAFVLIQAGVGMASRVGQAVSAIQGVRSADIVTGPYDVVAREAASIDALGSWSSRRFRRSKASPGP